MENDTDLISQKKIAKRWACIMSLLYLVPFPILLYASCFSLAILNPTDSTLLKLLQWIFVLLFLAIPLSIPFSIFCMWRHYLRRNFSEVGFYCVLPILTFFVCYFLIEAVGVFLHP